MKQILIILFALFFSLTVKADMPGPAYQYDRYSEDEKFYFKSIPFYNYDLTNFGKTLIIDALSKKELYKIDNYLPSESFISNDGKSLVTTTYWMSGHSDLEEQDLITIYTNGKNPIKYYLNDLISKKSMLQQTTSHTLWYNKMFVTNDTLNILSLEDKIVRISLTTGKIIDKIEKENCFECGNLDELVEPKTTYYRNIKYPKGYIFPDLVNKKDFHSSLISGLKRTEVEEYSDAVYSIFIYGTIDRNGNCEIFMLNTSVNEKENKEWEKQVSEWVLKQKYKTDLIPENCDKWVFQEYFYLK